MTRIEDLDGRVAVVTGGASGIGKGIAAELARAGARVIIVDIDETALSETAAELGASGLKADVTSIESMEGLAHEVLRQFGRVDIVVNNAGVGPLGLFADLSLEDYRWVMDINFWGVFHGITAFLPHLRANRQGGYIVNTASLAAFIPAPSTSAYAASKAAIVALSESLAAELDAEGRIGLSILAPGMVRTNITANSTRRPGYRAGGHKTEDFLPPFRVLAPETVGQLVVKAIRDGERYIFTHPEEFSDVQQHFEQLKLSFEWATAQHPETGLQGARPPAQPTTKK
jgi:NAD(P)-dependent dehydrogenase (short-subunit alcohol dehydrogenase family)